MREKQIEHKLVAKIKARGGMALKLNPIGMNGIPDRLVLLPGGIAFFAELKAPGKKPGLLQTRRMKQLEDLGFRCFVLDSEKEMDEVIKNAVRPA